jgi:hypothetical protein
MIRHLKLIAPEHSAKSAKLYIDGSDNIPFVSCLITTDINNNNRAKVTMLVKSFEFEGEVNLKINGLIVGYECEKELYYKLKQKFEPKK